MSCGFTVTVVDTTPPAITYPPNEVVPAMLDGSGLVSFQQPDTSDNWGVVGLVQVSGVRNNTKHPIGVYDVVWKVEDRQGLEATCTQKFAVSKQSGEIVICPDDITVEITDPEQSSVTVTYPPPTFFGEAVNAQRGLTTSIKFHFWVSYY